MKNQTIAVSAADINTGTDMIYDCRMIISTDRGQSKSSPRRIFFTNGSGVALEFNVLSESEIEEFRTTPARFTGMRIANGGNFSSWEIFGESKLENVDYIKVKGLVGGAIAAVTVYCLNYE